MSYQPDAMFETQEVYRRAIYQHRPKQWPREVHMLITQPRENGIPIIKETLPHARFRITPYDHVSLFDGGIGDILRFFDDALHHENDVGMFS